MDTYLVIDIGTSSTKCALFSANGIQVASVSKNYDVLMQRSGWAEQNPDIWYEAVCELCPSLIHDNLGCEILAVVVTGQAPTCAPVDLQGHPQIPALLWLDRRSTPQVDWLREKLGELQAYEISGNRLDSYFGGVKFLWFIQNYPDLYAKTWKILQANSFITYRLTGRAVIDPSQAGFCSPCYDQERVDWSTDVLKIMGIHRDVLPEIMPSASIVGNITMEAARQTGLKNGTPVVCGGGDFACSCLGAGVTSAGSAAIMLGTAGNLLVPAPPNRHPNLLNTRHITGERLSLGGVMSGGSLHWFTSSILGLKGDESYAGLEAEAIKTQAGSGGLLFLPYLMGERTPIWDPHARGAFIGLTSQHTQAHMYRAIMEGIAYAFRQMADLIGGTGSKLAYATAVDGGSRSVLWRQIFADVLKLPIHFHGSTGGTGLGAAYLAAFATGAKTDFTTVQDWLEPAQVTSPNPEFFSRYDKLFERYTGLYPLLANEFHALGDIL